jgi:hypothetical protein
MNEEEKQKVKIHKNLFAKFFNFFLLEIEGIW